MRRTPLAGDGASTVGRQRLLVDSCECRLSFKQKALAEPGHTSVAPTNERELELGRPPS